MRIIILTLMKVVVAVAVVAAVVVVGTAGHMAMVVERGSLACR